MAFYLIHIFKTQDVYNHTFWSLTNQLSVRVSAPFSCTFEEYLVLFWTPLFIPDRICCSGEIMSFGTNPHGLQRHPIGILTRSIDLWKPVESALGHLIGTLATLSSSSWQHSQNRSSWLSLDGDGFVYDVQVPLHAYDRTRLGWQLLYLMVCMILCILQSAWANLQERISVRVRRQNATILSAVNTAISEKKRCVTR